MSLSRAMETSTPEDQEIIQNIIAELVEDHGHFDSLTPRQLQAASIMAVEGLGAKGVSGRMGASSRTVEDHNREVYARTGKGSQRLFMAAIIRKLLGQMAELRTQLEERNEN